MCSPSRGCEKSATEPMREFAAAESINSGCSRPADSLCSLHHSSLVPCGAWAELPSKQQMTSFLVDPRSYRFAAFASFRRLIALRLRKEQAKRAADATPRPRRQHKRIKTQRTKFNPPPRGPNPTTRQLPGPPRSPPRSRTRSAASYRSYTSTTGTGRRQTPRRRAAS